MSIHDTTNRQSLARRVEVSEDSMPRGENDGRSLLTTMTKEIYMLARLHYDLLNPEKISRVFLKLRCMKHDPVRDRWVWLYEAEAKKLKFKGTYKDIPIERRPIVLGAFFFRNKGEMILDLNSFDRAIKAVVFFDKYLPRKAAKVKDISILNKFHDGSKGFVPKHQDFFDKGLDAVIDPDGLIEDLRRATSTIEDPIEKANAAYPLMMEGFQKSISEVERMPIHFYEDGISSLKGRLSLREIIAMQHWQGNSDYSLNNVFEQILPLILPSPKPEK
ncbi:hypothetical protein [Desulfobacter sp.]|uniref:hypothetical protein n=1 Tax=Desulfobacter sp. TaxID=2294 RepID=UPI00257EF038|nr:hypothetical protein [Desulfobacter sp.]